MIFVARSVSSRVKGVVQRAVLSWFREHARDLPWRGTRDLYRIWISEIMLQQTQVITVIDYYRRFLKRFPDVQTLAQASEAEVCGIGKAWVLSSCAATPRGITRDL